MIIMIGPQADRFLDWHNETIINMTPAAKKTTRPAIKADGNAKSCSPASSRWIAELPMRSIEAGSGYDLSIFIPDSGKHDYRHII